MVIFLCFKKESAQKNSKSVAGNRMSDERTGFGRKAKKNPKRRHCIQNPAPWWMVTVGAFCMEKEAQTALPNASTTKILTCIVAMEQCKPDEVVTFSAKAASQPKVHLGAKKRRTVLYAGSVVWADAGIL